MEEVIDRSHSLVEEQRRRISTASAPRTPSFASATSEITAALSPRHSVVSKRDARHDTLSCVSPSQLSAVKDSGLDTVSNVSMYSEITVEDKAGYTLSREEIDTAIETLRRQEHLSSLEDDQGYLQSAEARAAVETLQRQQGLTSDQDQEGYMQSADAISIVSDTLRRLPPSSRRSLSLRSEDGASVEESLNEVSEPPK